MKCVCRRCMAECVVNKFEECVNSADGVFVMHKGSVNF